MSTYRQFRIVFAAIIALIITVLPAAALLNADSPAKPLMTHDFTDVPVTGQEFMEEYINEFYHLGITGGCSTSPLMYCPTNPVTRGSMAVFMGRALGYVDAVTDGYTTQAYFKNTGSGWGVVGRSENGRGVYGISTDGNGVRGHSTTAYGVYANSAEDSALYAEGQTNGAESYIDNIYDIELGGLIGEIYGSSSFSLISDNDVYVRLNHDDNNILFTEFRIYNGDSIAVFRVDEDGNMHANGNTSASGTKSAIVDTVHYGTRAVYAVEATEVLFEDVGGAELVGGEVVIEIDPIFAETVNLSEEYHVFLTPVDGWADLYVTNRTALSFTVRSADGSDVEFSYRIVAKRLGYEDTRLEEVNP